MLGKCEGKKRRGRLSKIWLDGMKEVKGNSFVLLKKDEKMETVRV